MKSFKEYLTESTKVYEFKVKIAGEHQSDVATKIKAALGEFEISSCSAGKRTPIQERHSEFPEHRNVHMTVYDIATNYPCTSKQIQDKLCAIMNISHASVKVRSMAEEKEMMINHQYDKLSGQALGGTMQEPSDNSDLVGEKHKMNFLSSLTHERHQGTQVKGFNDEILARSVPGLAKEYRKEKQSTVEKAHRSPVAKRPDDIGAKAMESR
jgi:hypothetical protein